MSKHKPPALREVDSDRCEAMRAIERRLDRTRHGVVCPKITVLHGLVVDFEMGFEPMTAADLLRAMTETPRGKR